MEFELISLKHQKEAQKCLCATPYWLSEASFTSLYLWAEVYHTEVAFQDGLLFVRTGHPGDQAYLFPVGHGDLKHGLDLIRADAQALGIEPKLIAVTDHMRERLESIVANQFDYTPMRDHFDYIYDPQELVTLPGKKFHQKRNHVNRFMKEYDGRFSYESITEENLGEVIMFQQKWLEQNSVGEKAEGVLREGEVLKRLFDHYFTLNPIGGLLRIDGQVVAYSVGSRLCRYTALVQVEKGDINYHGVYQMMNQQFVLHNFTDALYINREDDAGSEGLRRAKLSYQPKFLLRKYVAQWK